MREILFRGKFGNEWKYGFLSIEPKGLVIKEPYKNESSNVWHIDADTVGQYTGMKDKNGTKIFEGDIIDFLYRSDDDDYGIVQYDVDETEFGFVYNSIFERLGRYYRSKDIEVIGNIHDNPELMEERREKKMDNKLKIREVCGDYALDIPFADGSVNTIYFNSKQNAKTVKHIIEVDGSKLNEATVCDVQEIKHGKWNFEKDICGCAWFICTNCHKNIIMVKHRLYPYCPYCGAKMDRG